MPILRQQRRRLARVAAFFYARIRTSGRHTPELPCLRRTGGVPMPSKFRRLAGKTA